MKSRKAIDRSSENGGKLLITKENHPHFLGSSPKIFKTLPELSVDNLQALTVESITLPNVREYLEAWVVKTAEGHTLYIPQHLQLLDQLKTLGVSLADVFARCNLREQNIDDPAGKFTPEWFLWWCYVNRRAECKVDDEFDSFEDMLCHFTRDARQQFTRHILNESQTTAARFGAGPAPLVEVASKKEKSEPLPEKLKLEPPISVSPPMPSKPRTKQPPVPTVEKQPSSEPKEEPPKRKLPPVPTVFKEETPKRKAEDTAAPNKKQKIEKQELVFFVKNKLASIRTEWMAKKPDVLEKAMKLIDELEAKDHPLDEQNDFGFLDTPESEITPDQIEFWLHIMLSIELQCEGDSLPVPESKATTFPELVLPVFKTPTSLEDVSRTAMNAYRVEIDHVLKKYMQECEKIHNALSNVVLKGPATTTQLARFIINDPATWLPKFMQFWEKTKLQRDGLGNVFRQHRSIFNSLFLHYVRVGLKITAKPKDNLSASDFD